MINGKSWSVTLELDPLSVNSILKIVSYDCDPSGEQYAVYLSIKPDEINLPYILTAITKGLNSISKHGN